ncbi:MAG TPA: hypothetical protein PLI00_05720 [Pseudomonadota bacterium]|nr:hypothetical protein [Xanthomonadales bacterium]HQW63284.1 hypothetical protein [Pseudomonadota bacterium]HQX24309.1 hypothetical protein [Pseudomonadota bacterium]HQY36055.1 hypothetical protein [Pseudomonadota bacterium]HRA37090.1 hypothetical protein [Pseudomonadota bacterium]
MARSGLKFAALAAAGLSLCAPLAQALNVTEAFDGSYFNPAQSGRGVLVDVIPGALGSVTFFAAGFTYDNAGNPFWYTIQPVLAEGQSTVTGTEVRRFNGGSFGDTFTPPNPATGTVIGTANLSINTCNSITLTITTNAASNGLPNVTQQLQPIGGPSANCPYTTAFTACPTGTTAVAGQTATCALTGTITGNLTLPNNALYVINGKVQVGTPLSGAATTPGTLTIQAGTVLKGAGSATADYLVVNPGSRIYAEGNPDAPIIFTGPTETSGSWAGVFIAGRAVVNTAGTPGGTVPFEADPAIIFGGNLPNDNSGTLRYVQIRHAGRTIAPNAELNCLTLGGVGAGTTLEYIQCHNGTDDAFEWFGGNVNAKYLVATGNDDDNLDMDFGFSGRIQYVYVRTDSQVDTADGRCVESDNATSTGNQNALPRTQPRIANLTCSGPQGFEALRLRRGSAGNYYNSVFTGYPTCLRFNDGSTYTAAGTPGALSGTTTMAGSFVSCATNFSDGSSPPFTVEAWFNSQAQNVAGPATALTGRFATPGGPLDGTAVGVPADPLQLTGTRDAFFDTVSFKGAFGPAGVARDWAAGWTAAGTLQ